MKGYVPYTYLIGWSKYDKWYYGSETSIKNKIANPSNLWVTYFTSSKHVKNFRKVYGEPDIIQIRKTFNNKTETCLWEHKVLKRLNVLNEEKWLNKSTTKVHYRTGIKHTLETKIKMSLKRKGRKPNLGHKHSEETKKLMSLQRIGNKHRAGILASDETKIKMKISRQKYLNNKRSEYHRDQD